MCEVGSPSLSIYIYIYINVSVTGPRQYASSPAIPRFFFHLQREQYRLAGFREGGQVKRGVCSSFPNPFPLPPLFVYQTKQTGTKTG